VNGPADDGPVDLIGCNDYEHECEAIRRSFLVWLCLGMAAGVWTGTGCVP
jgi:hypothetical protein